MAIQTACASSRSGGGDVVPHPCAAHPLGERSAELPILALAMAMSAVGALQLIPPSGAPHHGPGTASPRLDRQGAGVSAGAAAAGEGAAGAGAV